MKHSPQRPPSRTGSQPVQGQHPCDVVTVACGVCAILKKQTNHWWIVLGYKAQFRCLVFGEKEWANAKAAAADPDGSGILALAVACGEDHVHQLFSWWLTARSFDPPSARPIARPANEPMAQSPDEPIPSPSPASTRQEKP